MFERVNPVTEGINAYKAVNDIFRGDREEQRAIAETEYNRNRQARLDEMSAESHKAALESNALAQETSRLQLKKEKDAAEANKWQAIKLMALRNPQGWYNDLDPSDTERIIAETKSDPKFAFLHTPEARRTQLAKIQQIYAAMPNPDKPQFDMPSLLEGMNHVFASQLAKGTDDKGEPAKKEIVSFTMDPRDKSFIPELKITRKDGSSYTAPMTVDPLTGERSSSPDSIVKKITIPQIADYLGVAEGLINLADAKQVSLGDDEPLKAALAEIKGKKESKQLAGAVTAIDKAWDPTKSAKENTLTGLAAALETAPDSASAIKALEVVLKAKEEKETDIDFKDAGHGWIMYTKGPKKGQRERVPVKPDKEGSGAGSKMGDAEKTLYNQMIKAWQDMKKITSLPAGSKTTVEEYDPIMQTTRTKEVTVQKETVDAARAIYYGLERRGMETYGWKPDATSINAKQPQKKAPEARKASAKDVAAAIKGATTKQQAIFRLKAKGFTHDEMGREI